VISPDDVIKKLSALAGVDVLEGVFPTNPELDEAFKLVDTNKPAISEQSTVSTKPSISDQIKEEK
jgi:hypothetical protein